jgi:hypothetical protein
VGRAMNVQAIRRSHGGPVEIKSGAGHWIRYTMVTDATKRNCGPWLEAYGDEHHGKKMFPAGDFLWVAGPAGDDLEDLYEQAKQEQDSQDDQQDSQSQDSQSQGQNGGDVTIEDIIRKIAGEMDNASFVEKLPEFINAMQNVVDAKLKDYVPQGNESGDLFAVTTQIDLSDVSGKLESKKGIFHKQFDKLVKALAAGQHTFLPGPPGTGKSHAAEQAASILDWRFASLSLGPTTPESRLWGGMDAHGKFFEPPFVKLARHAMENPDSGSVYCLDELDNGHPGVIATLNSAMANGWFTAPNGDVITMGRNFVIVGAANTYGTGPTAEFAGRNKLDAATLDRFVYLPWDTDLGVESALTKTILECDVAKAWLEVWRTCRKNAKDNGLKVFVTMRGCLNGAKLIAAGFAPTEALDMVLLNKLPDDQRRKVAP